MDHIWGHSKSLWGEGGGGDGCLKMNKSEQEGGEGSKLGDFEQTYFLNVPY